MHGSRAYAKEKREGGRSPFRRAEEVGIPFPVLRCVDRVGVVSAGVGWVEESVPSGNNGSAALPPPWRCLWSCWVGVACLVCLTTGVSLRRRGVGAAFFVPGFPSARRDLARVDLVGEAVGFVVLLLCLAEDGVRWCSERGRCCEEGDLHVELLSPVLLFVTAWCALALPWKIWRFCGFVPAVLVGGWGRVYRSFFVCTRGSSCCSSASWSPAGRGGEGRCGVVELLVAAAGMRGLQVRDLATSSEVGCRWAQFRCGSCSGCVPGRCPLFVSRSSSSELVVVAARQRLWSRSSSCSAVRLCSRRLRREVCLFFSREEDEDEGFSWFFAFLGVLRVGLRQQCLLSFPLRSFQLVSVSVMFSLSV